MAAAITLHRQDLAFDLVAVLNRQAARRGRTQRARWWAVNKGSRTAIEVQAPGVRQEELTAILRLLLSDIPVNAISPSMVEREIDHPRFGAKRDARVVNPM